ncbi:MAG TPA: cupin domain-containing protein [Ktedonobacteraceae bacterium]|nr:cupin domain-containing protein [Ktedonobacteraceae bacterium]
MDAFELSELVHQHGQSIDAYLEFLRVPALSMGLYKLSAGGIDLQEPHTEDEVYYIVSGRGAIQVGEENRAVEPGTIVFVGANVEHRFHSITEDLMILVFFAPAEYTLAPENENIEEE